MPFPKKGYPLTVEDCEKVSLKNKSNWFIQGFSKAGERTSFKINPLNILLDVGLTKLLEAASILSYPKETFTEIEVWDRHFMSPRPIAAGDKFTINKVQIEALQATHTVNALGYGFSTEKLNPPLSPYSRFRSVRTESTSVSSITPVPRPVLVTSMLSGSITQVVLMAFLDLRTSL